MLELVQSLRGAVRYATSLERLGTSICHFRLIAIWMTNCESVRVATSYFSCLAQEHRLFVCAAGWLFCVSIHTFSFNHRGEKATLWHETLPRHCQGGGSRLRWIATVCIRCWPLLMHLQNVQIIHCIIYLFSHVKTQIDVLCDTLLPTFTSGSFSLPQQSYLVVINLLQFLTFSTTIMHTFPLSITFLHGCTKPF